MDANLREQVQRGTVMYPLQIYNITSEREKLCTPCHWHKEIEVLYIIKGKFSLMVDEEKFTGRAGDIFWISQEQLHGISTCDELTEYYALVFPMEYLNFEMFDYVQSRYLNPLCHKKMFYPAKIPSNTAHYRKVWDELMLIAELDRERNQGYQIAVKASLLKCISMLIQDELLCSMDEKDLNTADYKMQNLKAILAYINKKYSEKLNLEDLAEEFNLSAKYFSRYFKKNFNQSFVEYLNRYRIEQAAGLLMNTDMPIGEIALCVGFDNFSYFIRQFKKTHHCTPSFFRKQGQLPSVLQHLNTAL